jgi:hypothetical protein
MSGDLIAPLVLAGMAAALALLAARDRLRSGTWPGAARTRLKVAAIFGVVAMVLAGWRFAG